MPCGQCMCEDTEIFCVGEHILRFPHLPKEWRILMRSIVLRDTNIKGRIGLATYQGLHQLTVINNIFIDYAEIVQFSKTLITDCPLPARTTATTTDLTTYWTTDLTSASSMPSTMPTATNGVASIGIAIGIASSIIIVLGAAILFCWAFQTGIC